jgi:hypothetical protein
MIIIIVYNGEISEPRTFYTKCFFLQYRIKPFASDEIPARFIENETLRSRPFSQLADILSVAPHP